MFQKILQKKNKRIIGLMSGTSMDGIDTVLLNVSGSASSTRFEIVQFDMLQYTPQVRSWLLDAGRPGKTDAAGLCRVNAFLGEMFARAAQHICRKAKFPIEEVDLIGSHGQTLIHLPEMVRMAGIDVRSTLQIGDPAIIAERTGVTTVANFRTRDLAAGGQGAPLMAFVDFLVFRSRARGRIILNLGGIANLTALPPNCAPESVLAFDTGPGNCLIDQFVASMTGNKEQFDFQGRYASRGTCQQSLLDHLLDHPFLSKPPPKSCDRTSFSISWVEEAVRSTGVENGFDTLATLCRFTACSVRRACEQFLFPAQSYEELIVSGGGTKNEILMKELAEQLSKLDIKVSDEYGLPADAKEAVGFALLANEALHGHSNHLPAATGARHSAILGMILPGRLVPE